MASIIEARRNILLNTPHSATASGAIASFSTDFVAPLKSCVVDINPVQSGTNPSPSNPCPISGWTGVNVHVADGENPHVVDNIYPITWQSSAGTVYGGNIDVLSGVLKATHKYYENAGTGSWGVVTQGGNRYYIGGVSTDAKNASVNGKCNIGNLVYGFISDGVLVGSNGRINLCGSLYDAFASVNALKTYLQEHPLQVVYELATPLTYQLTPTQVKSLVGANNIFADTGNVSLKYWTH